MGDVIDVDTDEARDVCDMAAALLRARESLGDVTLYRAIVGLVEDSRAAQKAEG